jgi:nucleoside-diphosphate-sugar epimerase
LPWRAHRLALVVTRIAVTGSSGFIGRHFGRWLEQHGVEPVRLDRAWFAAGAPRESLRAVQAIVHLAARAHRLREEAADPGREFEASNVELTDRVASAAAAAGVRRLVFVSSAGVLGNASPPAGFRDGDAPAPHDLYTRSKLAAEERLASGYGGALDVVILRPPMVYGPGAPGNFARILRAAASGWPLPVGSLEAPRSLVSVRNLCDLLLLAATSSQGAGARMLVSDAETTSVADLVRRIGAAAGRSVRPIRLPSWLLEAGLRAAGRGADGDRLLRPFVVRGERARQEFGWEPPFRLAGEIEWTVREPLAGGRPA